MAELNGFGIDGTATGHPGPFPNIVKEFRSAKRSAI